mgnify:CR=1 FL=1
MAELAELDARARDYVDQRNEVMSRLEDLAFFLRGYADDLDASPQRLQDVEDRLAALERLKRKHGPALEDVIEPYLIQEGFLQRTNRGRIATRSAYLHFGIQVPAVRDRPELGNLFE